MKLLGLLVGLALAVIYLAATLAAWLAAFVGGMFLLLAFFNWIGWKATHHLGSWHAFIGAMGYAGLCVLIVFVVKGLPLFFIRPDPRPALDQRVAQPHRLRF